MLKILVKPCVLVHSVVLRLAVFDHVNLNTQTLFCAHLIYFLSSNCFIFIAVCH